MLTYMISASFVSFLLILSGFFSKNMVLDSWESRLFPRKVVWARPIVPTDNEEPNNFLPKLTKLSPGRRMLRLGLLAAIEMEYLIPNDGILQD